MKEEEGYIYIIGCLTIHPHPRPVFSPLESPLCVKRGVHCRVSPFRSTVVISNTKALRAVWRKSCGKSCIHCESQTLSVPAKSSPSQADLSNRRVSFTCSLSLSSLSLESPSCLFDSIDLFFFSPQDCLHACSLID